MRNICLLLILFFFNACNWFEVPEEGLSEEIIVETQDLSIHQLEIPENFKFTTTYKLSLKISAVDNQGELLKNVPFALYEQQEESMHIIMTGTTGSTAIFETNFLVGAISEKLILSTGYPGIPDRYEIPVQEGNIEVRMGDPEKSIVIQGLAPDQNSLPRYKRQSTISLRSNNYGYLGSYNNQGVPDYLETQNDVISQSLLDQISNSLPEGQPVPEYNPQYISNAVSSSTKLIDLADLWVTFVHEGAGYRNALGFYTYPTDTPPSSPDQISDFTIIFPNVSYQGSGGGLQTGNKVYLGQFSAGTSVGWFLVPNGWDSGALAVNINDDKPIKYSNSNLNDFTAEVYRSHTVLLKNELEEKLLLGFEDIGRPGGDKDFNDAIFYISANPYSAIQTAGVASVQTTSSDADQDGVPDQTDLFANDPDIAFVNYSPASGQFSTLAFEDQWPSTGDYDMNDMVIDYNIQEYRNADNKTIKLRASFVLKAMGAGYQNGFGFQLNLPPSAIQSATGSLLQDNYIELASNGLESGQEKAVVIVFDNGFRLLRNPEGGFVNTEPGRPRLDFDTIQIDIDLAVPQLASALGVAPYNPFIIKNRERGIEIHLLDHPPTSKATTSLFGTDGDKSIPNQNKFYRTESGLPWAIHIARPFDWPVEKAAVNKAYLKFNDWAQSGGFNYPDWYMGDENYRDQVKIY